MSSSISQKFKKLFIDTFGENTRLHVKFKLDGTFSYNIEGATGGEQPNQDRILNLDLLIGITKNHLNSSIPEAESTP